ncbi:Protein CNGC15c [Bienertia sinuspersici]
MPYEKSRSVRFGDEVAELAPASKNNNTNLVLIKQKYTIDGTKIEPSSLSLSPSSSHSLKTRVLSRVFSEDYEGVKKKIHDPSGSTINKWNKVFLVACLVSLFIDPLFFFLPAVKEDIMCIEIELNLEIILTALRTIADVFYMIQIYFKFRTSYIAPSSRVFGRGELVVDPKKIALRYLKNGFFIDFVAALPLPQVLIWGVIPNLGGSMMMNTKNVLRFILIFQYLPRLFLIFPLSSQIVKATGVVTETAWAGAAYNLMLFIMASHVLGASWYLLSIEREEACWENVCSLEKQFCKYTFFDCRRVNDIGRKNWFKLSNITNLCDPDQSNYPFGVYGEAVTTGVTSSPFFNKYFYCLWWGLKNLSALGQDLSTSTSVGEIVFAIIVATLGLVLFALLIGNMQYLMYVIMCYNLMQTYLQSTTVRLEEWRIRRTDTEQWMHHRQLPPELKESVRRYDQYKWVATRGVDEEALLQGLPLDLRRDIKRHLCLDLVRRVPLFDQMEERMLDAICERLKPALSTEGTYLVREGDPVNEMLFIIRGHLDSYTTNGGRTGFFNSCKLGPGDFCGEELLTWALDPRPSVILPSSTRTVKAISEVEAFALIADDLKFVAAQFRKLHSKQLRHKFRFYSHHWRLWAACFIQAAWRRHKRRRNSFIIESKAHEEDLINEADQEKLNAGDYIKRFAASKRKGGKSNHLRMNSTISSLQKPAEPDFSIDED